MSSNIDNQMKLLAGLPITVEGIEIAPLKLREIADIGYLQFQQNVQILMLDLDTMIESIDDFETKAVMKANKATYKVFDLFMFSDELRKLIIDSLKMIFKTDDIEYVDDEYRGSTLLVNQKNVIDRDNFETIVKVVDIQNNPKVSKVDEDDDYKPADEVAKRIADKLKKSKEIVSKSKAVENNKEGITITDVISSVSAMSNSVNKINIWEYTLYQLYEEFARLNRIDNYKLQIQASMWSSDIEIEHWSEPL